MSSRDWDSSSESDDERHEFGHEPQDFLPIQEVDDSSRSRQRKSHKPPKGIGHRDLSSSAPFWQLHCPPAPFSGGGNPMGFPFNAQQTGGHWAYPSYPTAVQVLPGGPLTMPPWCNYYRSTMNADPLAMINRPSSAISGPLTGPAISGPFIGPAPSRSPAGPFAGRASLDRPAPILSEARLPEYIPVASSTPSTPSLSKRREPCPQQAPSKRKRTAASERQKRKEPSEQPSAPKRSRLSDDDSGSGSEEEQSLTFEETEEQEDQVTESFDPDNYYASSGQSLPLEITDYVERRFKKCIPLDKRKKMFKDNPIPDTPAAKPPQPDDDIVAFLGKDFPTKSDKRLRRIQATTIAVAGPLTTLWANMIDQNMGQGSGTLISVDDVIDTIQRSLSLLGNSVNYISQARRDLIISQLEYKKKGLGKVMRKVCQSDLGNTGKELFGEKFRKTLKSKADSMVAFGKIADRVEQNTHNKNQSFRGGPSTSRYASGAGKNPKSYQKTGQSRPYSRWSQPRRYFHQNQQRKQDFLKQKNTQ